MSDIKSIFGLIPSYLANMLIKIYSPGLSAEKYVNFVNSFPNWFRFVDQKFLVETNFGFKIWADRTDVIGQALIRNGQWEGLVSNTIFAALKQGDIAVDIGANIGYDTMLMSKAVGPKGIVLAFEPDLTNLHRLLENLLLNDENNVMIQTLGLGDERCIAHINSGLSGNAGTSNLRPNEQEGARKLIVGRLDQVLPSSEFNRISLVKIDVEGFEFKAILGMGNFIDRVDVVVCEIDPFYLRQCGTTPAEIFGFMKEHGFSSYCAQPNSVDKWQPSGPDYKINVNESKHFDALFCRTLTPALAALVMN